MDIVSSEQSIRIAHVQPAKLLLTPLSNRSTLLTLIRIALETNLTCP
jgi:hypothetical protein